MITINSIQYGLVYVDQLRKEVGTPIPLISLVNPTDFSILTSYTLQGDLLVELIETPSVEFKVVVISPSSRIVLASSDGILRIPNTIGGKPFVLFDFMVFYSDQKEEISKATEQQYLREAAEGIAQEKMDEALSFETQLKAQRDAQRRSKIHSNFYVVCFQANGGLNHITMPLWKADILNNPEILIVRTYGKRYSHQSQSG